MKKTILILSLLLTYSSAAFAATAISSTASTTFGTASPVPFKASTNVFMYAATDASGTTYTVVTQHKSAEGKAPKGKQYTTTATNPGITESNAGAGHAQPTMTAGQDATFQ